MTIDEQIVKLFWYYPDTREFLRTCAAKNSYSLMDGISDLSLQKFFEVSDKEISMWENQKNAIIIQVYGIKATTYCYMGAPLTQLICFHNLEDFVMFKLRFQ